MEASATATEGDAITILIMLQGLQDDTVETTVTVTVSVEDEKLGMCLPKITPVPFHMRFADKSIKIMQEMCTRSFPIK